MPSPPIDLRSDTVTRPTRAMLDAMASAEVGDDVLGDDPTVLRLQERIAHIMGKEAACFVPSGTMANQAAIRAHTEPGDELLAHKDSHIIHYETGAPAALSGVMIRPLPLTPKPGDRGLYDAADVDDAVRPDSAHFPHSRLLIVENTHNRGGGAVWPLDQVRAVTERARAHKLRLHLDGARLWNACIKTGHKPADYARHFDTVSCCFSKGLGAPAGSAVCGDKAIIARVHRFRKMFGGAMRQAGLLAAAALHAVEHHVDRLSQDHANAARLAKGLAEIPGLSIALPVDTNMVFFDVDPRLGSAAELCARLKQAGVLMLPNLPHRVRAVTHLDVSTDQIDTAVAALGGVIAGHAVA
ncbi:MAG: aminotransferase class I/II-fold pyridoxal phosphate-dependent enzyme [Phycisphaeraceae bacterium]|nr:aminotransferase class I/II-fold pyridoxal phosphate-dependent enzyme [Phycisphaeraceae bacterium]